MMPTPYRTTIVEAGLSRDLTVLATVKEELGITDTENDAWLQTKITQASIAIATACNRKFHQETIADHFKIQWPWGYTCDPLVLSRPPIVEVISVTEGSAELDVSAYEWESSNGLLWRISSGSFRSTWNLGPVIVTYKGGHELLGTLPEDIELACIILVKGSWFSRTRDPDAKSINIPGVVAYNFSTGDGSSSGASGMPPEVMQLISPYRLVCIA